MCSTRLLSGIACYLVIGSGHACEPSVLFEAVLDDEARLMMTISQQRIEDKSARPAKSAKELPVWGAIGNDCVTSGIVVIVNGAEIVFPRNSVRDLRALQVGPAFINKPIITGTAKAFEVRLVGGDGGESYRAAFKVKNRQLQQRTVFAFGKDGEWRIREVRRFK